MKKIIDWLGYVPPLGVDNTTLGGKLYEYRMKFRLTQKDISLDLKMDNFRIVNIENGKALKTKNIEKIRTLLDGNIPVKNSSV